MFLELWRSLGLILLGVFLFSKNSYSQITWKQQHLSLAVEEDVVDQSFTFFGKNNTEHPIRIQSIKSDCGCVNVTSSSMFFLPGEQVLIKGNVHIGDSPSDVIKKNILIEIEGRKEPESLSIELVEKKHVLIKPRVVIWEKSDIQTKKVLINLNGFGSKIDLIKIENKGDQFTINNRIKLDDDLYELWITPVKSQNSATAQFVVIAKDHMKHVWQKNFYCIKEE
jgi:hypothetical protein